MRLDAPSPANLHALAQLLATNLVVFAAWVVEWSAWWPFQAAVKRSLRKQLRRAGRAFARIACLIAIARIDAPARAPKRTHHPGNAPPGFRLHTSGKVRRFLHISGLHQGSLNARIARLKRMLERLDHWVARFRKRLRDRTKTSRLVLTHALADVCADRASTPALRAADTS